MSLNVDQKQNIYFPQLHETFCELMHREEITEETTGWNRAISIQARVYSLGMAVLSACSLAGFFLILAGVKIKQGLQENVWSSKKMMLLDCTLLVLGIPFLMIAFTVKNVIAAIIHPGIQYKAA